MTKKNFKLNDRLILNIQKTKIIFHKIVKDLYLDEMIEKLLE